MAFSIYHYYWSVFPNMNIALHLRREVLNYKDCTEACTCHPKRWTYWNIDACKNVKNRAGFVFYSEMWHLARYVWTQTSMRPGRMTDNSPLYKGMEFHIIRSSFLILLLGFPVLFVGVFFPFSLFFFANLHFPFYFVLFSFIVSFFCSSSCFFFCRFFLLSRSFLSIFLFYLSVFLSSCFVSPSFVCSSRVSGVSL